MSLTKSYFKICSVPNPRAWLNAYLKSPDVVIFDQNLSIKLLKLCFPCCLSSFSSYFSLCLSHVGTLFRLIFSAILLVSYYVTFCLCFLPLVFASLVPVYLLFFSFLPHFTALPTQCSAVLVLYLFSFQPSAFISTLCFRLFPCGSMQTWWVTIMFFCRLTGSEDPR